MKKLGLKITAAAIVLASIGCGKTEKIIQMQDTGSQPETSNSQTYGTTVEGIETHGGNVRMSRQNLLKDTFLLTDVELERKYASSNSRGQKGDSLEAVRSMLFKYYLSVIEHKQDPNNDKVKEIFDKMLTPEKNVLDRIINLKFDVKEIVPRELNLNEEQIAKEPKYGFCYNEEGNKTTASTKLGDMQAEICVDLKILADENPEYNELIGLVSHELAHNYGFDHADAMIFQDFVTQDSRFYSSSLDDILWEDFDYEKYWNVVKQLVETQRVPITDIGLQIQIKPEGDTQKIYDRVDLMNTVESSKMYFVYENYKTLGGTYIVNRHSIPKNRSEDFLNSNYIDIALQNEENIQGWQVIFKDSIDFYVVVVGRDEYGNPTGFTERIYVDSFKQDSKDLKFASDLKIPLEANQFTETEIYVYNKQLEGIRNGMNLSDIVKLK